MSTTSRVSCWCSGYRSHPCHEPQRASSNRCDVYGEVAKCRTAAFGDDLDHSLIVLRYDHLGHWILWSRVVVIRHWIAGRTVWVACDSAGCTVMHNFVRVAFVYPPLTAESAAAHCCHLLKLKFWSDSYFCRWFVIIEESLNIWSLTHFHYYDFQPFLPTTTKL